MTAAQTSGGIPLTRARLTGDLGLLPVHAAYAKRDAPYCWRIVHALDRSRTYGDYAKMSDVEFEAMRRPAIEQAAAALTAVGYKVVLRLIPDEEMLDSLPPSLRRQMADTVPTLQAVIVPD